jgi:hypothetical protein
VVSKLRYVGRPVLWIGCFFLDATLCAADGDERFLEGLRQRRLFELAEKYCTERLSATQLPPVAQGDLAVELIRTNATHDAVVAPFAEKMVLTDVSGSTDPENTVESRWFFLEPGEDETVDRVANPIGFTDGGHSRSIRRSERLDLLVSFANE